MTNSIPSEVIGRSEDLRSCSTPEDFKNKFGRRFRMSKKQKEEGLSRQNAFVEFRDQLLKLLEGSNGSI